MAEQTGVSVCSAHEQAWPAREIHPLEQLLVVRGQYVPGEVCRESRLHSAFSVVRFALNLLWGNHAHVCAGVTSAHRRYSGEQRWA